MVARGADWETREAGRGVDDRWARARGGDGWVAICCGVSVWLREEIGVGEVVACGAADVAPRGWREIPRDEG